MISICASPRSPDYLFTFVSGALGRIIVGAHRLVVTPSIELCYPRRLGSVFTSPALSGIVKCFTEFTRLTLETMPDLSTPSIRPWRKTGKEFPCTVCGKIVYRRASQIARGIVKTCGSPECKSASMSGKNNPYWGRMHTPEIRGRIKEGLELAKPHRRKPGRKKGSKDTNETRKRKRKSMLDRWRLHRDEMLASLSHLKKNKPREEQRYRFCFTRWQRREWIDANCLWCGSIDDLVLDHVIPVMCGGINVKKNAQTLCQPCNLWKMVYVDRPLYLAGLGNQRG
jgi:5-methylcytosine-specific restriction endonuclease McrA